MELVTIQSEKDIKTLLLEEMKLAETEHVLIILSKNRFDEFQKREDVRKISYDEGNKVSSSSDITYSFDENENNIASYHYYITFTFFIIAELYVVKDFSTMHRSAYGAGTSEIHFIA